jgi:hypothetical protein
MGAAVSIGAVTFGAIFSEESLPRIFSLLLMRHWIRAGAVFVRNAAQPFAIEMASLTHLPRGGNDESGKDERESAQRRGERFQFHATSFLSEDNAAKPVPFAPECLWRAFLRRESRPEEATRIPILG